MCIYRYEHKSISIYVYIYISDDVDEQRPVPWLDWLSEKIKNDRNMSEGKPKEFRRALTGTRLYIDVYVIEFMYVFRFTCLSRYRRS